MYGQVSNFIKSTFNNAFNNLIPKKENPIPQALLYVNEVFEFNIVKKLFEPDDSELYTGSFKDDKEKFSGAEQGITLDIRYFVTVAGNI